MKNLKKVCEILTKIRKIDSDDGAYFSSFEEVKKLIPHKLEGRYPDTKIWWIINDNRHFGGCINRQDQINNSWWYLKDALMKEELIKEIYDEGIKILPID